MHKILFQVLFFVFVTFNCIQATQEPVVALRWKANDMRVLTVREWQKLRFDDASIENALAVYHQTSQFTQTPEEFFAKPHEFIQTRIAALDALLQAIEGSSDRSTVQLQSLKMAATRKKMYLEALPPPLEAHTVKFIGPSKRRDIKVREQFWFERLDPLHRFGPEVYIYLEEWVASEIPNYFIFLETVEYHPMLNSLAPFEHYVIYFCNEEERQAHLATFKHGKVYVQDTLLSNESTKRPFIFVLGTDNEFYINKQKIYEIHHSSEFAGGKVQSAGEMVVQNGKIISLSNSSGHYGPKAQDILPALRVLSERYGNLQGIDLTLHHEMGLTAIYDAQEYLWTQGRCAAKSTNNRWSPIHLAIALQQADIASQLIHKHVQKLKDPTYVNPWELAANNKDLKSLRFLLRVGLDPFDNAFTITGISWVARTGDVNLFEGFLKLLDESQIDKISSSDAILHAAFSGSLDMVQKLLKLGSDLEKRDQHNQNIMHYGVGGGPEMLQWLESQKLEHLLHEKGVDGFTVLHYAAQISGPETVQYLVHKGFETSLLDDNGNTPLHTATQYKNESVIRWFISDPLHHKFITQPNNEGVTPLHSGSRSLSTNLYREFIELVDDVDVVDINGLTPYGYVAQRYGSHDIQSNGILLLDKGASPLLPDATGMAPWQYIARTANMPALVHLLTHINMDMGSILQVIKNESSRRSLKLKLLDFIDK